MLVAKLAAMIGAVGCAIAGVWLVASGVKPAALIILAAATVTTVASEERDFGRRARGPRPPPPQGSRVVPSSTERLPEVPGCPP